MSTASTTSHVYPALTPAVNRNSLPKKPTDGGKPASESMKIVMSTAMGRLRR